MASHRIRHDLEQQQARREKQELIMLRSEVQQQSQTIESLTLKIKTFENLNTQLLEQMPKLRAENTTLRQRNTEIDAGNFRLRQTYDELQTIHSETLKNFRILENSYLENLQKLHILQNSKTR